MDVCLLPCSMATPCNLRGSAFPAVRPAYSPHMGPLLSYRLASFLTSKPTSLNPFGRSTLSGGSSPSTSSAARASLYSSASNDIPAAGRPSNSGGTSNRAFYPGTSSSDASSSRSTAVGPLQAGMGSLAAAGAPYLSSAGLAGSSSSNRIARAGVTRALAPNGQPRKVGWSCLVYL